MKATTKKRFVSCFLIIVFTLVMTTIRTNKNDAVHAAGLACFPETTQSGIAKIANVLSGSIVSGSVNKLSQKDQSYLVMNSAPNLTVNETSFWTEIDLGIAGTDIMFLEIDSAAKTSVSDCNQEIYLYNFVTLSYEKVAETTIGTKDTSCSYISESSSEIANYVSPLNKIRLKISITKPEIFISYFDYLNIIYRYKPGVANRAIASYDIDNAVIEYGAVSANNATYLKNRDASYFSVTSSSNKIAWSSSITLEQSRDEIRSLEINYSGSYSKSCNDTWLSLWNNNTGNWEVVYCFASDISVETIRWVTSDPATINKFVSEFNDVKIRLYNSGSTSFTRNSDYLNVTVYYDSAYSTKSYSPDTLQLDYGTIDSGNVTSLSLFDNDTVVISSDTSNKIAWKCSTTIDVDRQYVKALSVFTRVKYSGIGNNQYFSLWNYSTGNWVVFKTQTISTNSENVVFTITDPEELNRYISPSGEIQARLYNSASSAFTRSTDVLTFNIEYGTVGTFEIAHLSDVHELIGHSNFLAIIDEINNNVNPAFTVVTGDITDHGTPEQYDQYILDKEYINGTVYTIPGNHDMRWWNSNGKNDWKEKIGDLYFSFNYGGVHFVMMDSTAALELDEKFGKAQLEWLADDLSTIPKDMPVIIFAHHPFKIADNVTGKAELLEVVKDYNVVAFIAGHQHYYGYTIENGVLWEYITYIKDNNLQEFCSIKVTPNKLYIYKRKASDHSKVLWLTAPMLNKRKANLTNAVASVQPNGNVDVSITVDKAPDGVSKVEARIDNYGPWTTLTQNGNTWSGTINISNYSPAIPYGKHFVGFVMTDNAGKQWKTYKEYEWSGGNTSTKWVYQTGDLIQSTPTYYNGIVYVGSEDNKLYAINDSDGTLRWSYTTGDQIISKPAIYQEAEKDLLIFGSHDKKLYALNADTGEFEWSFTTGGSVISDPLVDNGTVYFGSGDKYIYALNAHDGTLKWKYLTEGLMRQRPVVYNGKLYAFVRDTYIWYAINIDDGSLFWRGNAGTDESLFVCGDVRPVLTGSNKLWCIDAQNTRPGYLNPLTGELEWYSTSIGNVSSRGMAQDGTRVFYVSGNGRQVYAINISDNSVAWYKDLRAGGSDSDMQEFQIDSALVYEDGIVYHVAERGRITGLNPVNGGIIFKYDAVGLPERVFWSTPEVHDRTVYVGGLDGKLYAIKYNDN
ncbi:MAG TPA: PQQ-binding-like beta-propeller repeat protein [Clostridiaceae bacterium]|nr:PQQ-binding-like beta-propeller repeat protein [Clostridiaceae bacterium]